VKPEVIVALLSVSVALLGVIVTIVGGTAKFAADRSLDRRLIQLTPTVAGLSDGAAKRAMQRTLDEMALVVAIRLRAPRYVVGFAIGWTLYLVGLACVLPSFVPQLWVWDTTEPPLRLWLATPEYLHFLLLVAFRLPWSVAFVVLTFTGYALMVVLFLVRRAWMLRLYEKETGRRFVGPTGRWLLDAAED
jgi:hypothetical protein